MHARHPEPPTAPLQIRDLLGAIFLTLLRYCAESHCPVRTCAIVLTSRFEARSRNNLRVDRRILRYPFSVSVPLAMEQYGPLSRQLMSSLLPDRGWFTPETIWSFIVHNPRMTVNPLGYPIRRFPILDCFHNSNRPSLSRALRCIMMPNSCTCYMCI
jgi:hypothetical protein